MKKTTAVLILGSLFAVVLELHAGTGWSQTAKGTYQFLDPANWDGGDINGIFPATWTPEDIQTLQLTNDWYGTLTFLGNIIKNITFNGRSDNNSKDQSRTITLEGDILVKPSTSSGQLTFNVNVGFDLGGETRSFLCYSPSTADRFRINGPISNGDLVLGGGGAGISLFANAAISGNVTIMTNTTLVVNYAPTGATVKRANDVELHRATLAVSAYRGDDTAEFGNIKVYGVGAPAASVITVANNSHISTLSAGSLEIVDGGTLAVLGDNLGAIDSPSSRIIFNTAPALVGDGGAAETPSVSVLPGVIAGLGAKSTIQTHNLFSLATYDPAVGIRKLAERETASEPSSSEAVNMVVSETTTTIDGDAEVNSLQMLTGAYNTTPSVVTGDGTLAVKSGMVLVYAGSGDGAKIDKTLDFGSVQGHIVHGGTLGGQPVKITRQFKGSGGLVLSRALATSTDAVGAPWSSRRGFQITASSEDGAYTGNTYIQWIAEVNSTPFLPHGTRSGNTIVNGCLSFGTIAINGLYGTGAVRGTTLTVGEDGSDGDFSGLVATTLNKVGAGTQRLSGTANGTLNVNAGKVVLDGTVTQGAVNVAAGAAIGGAGEIQTTLAFAEGAKLAVAVADDEAACLTVAGTVTGGLVTVDAKIKSGKWRTAQCILKSGEAVSATFKRGKGVGALELRNNGTELWATPKTSGFSIVIR